MIFVFPPCQIFYQVIQRMNATAISGMTRVAGIIEYDAFLLMRECLMFLLYIFQ